MRATTPRNRILPAPPAQATMEDFKLKHFKEDFPDAEFPAVHTLPNTRCANLKRKLAGKLGLATDVAPLKLLQTLYDSFRANELGNLATDSTFNLDTLLKESRVKTPHRVYINWHQFDRIDEIDFSDLVKYFDYFWYPSSDDIEIFDDNFSWVALIRHDGATRVVHLK